MIRFRSAGNQATDLQKATSPPPPPPSFSWLSRRFCLEVISHAGFLRLHFVLAPLVHWVRLKLLLRVKNSIRMSAQFYYKVILFCCSFWGGFGEFWKSCLVLLLAACIHSDFHTCFMHSVVTHQDFSTSLWYFLFVDSFCSIYILARSTRQETCSF